jgi:uncharacterized membrane protein
MPARGRIFFAMLGLAVIGLGIATYLTIVHYDGGSPVCAISHGCETVQHSRYSKLAGIPVAVIGLAGYVCILVTLLTPGAEAALATVAVTFVGLCFSLYLTYREIFTIKAICQWCVGSAVVMTALTVLAVVRYLRVGAPANTLAV